MRGPELDWEAHEATFAYARSEARRLVKRARRRIWLAIVVATLACGGYSALKILRPKPYEAQLTLRIVEADFDLTAAVRPPREYLNYVWSVFLASPRLRAVIEEHDLYPQKWERAPQLAIEAFRDDLDVVVWRNYFLEEHYGDDLEARSARVSIAWKDKDPTRVLEVVRALGQIIIEAQAEDRRQQFELAQGDLAQANVFASDRLLALQRQVARKRIELERARGERRTRLEVELLSLTEEEKLLGKRADEMGSARTRFEITAAWERERSGIRFELVDPGFVLPPSGAGPIGTALIALGIFFGSGLLAALLLGSLEVRIDRADDVRRLGLDVVGALPRFVGDDVGTLAERVRTEDRLKWERP